MESPVLVKAFSILESLRAASDAVSLGELASVSGLAKPTAHRIVSDLVSMGYVQRTESGRYQIGRRLRRLAGLAGDERLAAEAEGVLRPLHERTGETVNLAVMRGGRVVYLRVLESAYALRRVAEPGATDPFHSTALGRAIAAHWPGEWVEQLLRQAPLERRTPQTMTDPKKLRALLQRVRREGYAVEVDENDVGVMCVAAPVFDGGEVVGGISISAPSARVDRARKQAWVEQVCAAARTLRENLEDTQAQVSA